MKKRYLAGSIIGLALLICAAVACVPSADQTGPYTDTNANGLHDSGESIDCNSLPEYSGPTLDNWQSTTVVNVSNVKFTGGLLLQQPHVHFNNVCITGNGNYGIVKIEGNYNDPNLYTPVDIVFANTSIQRQFNETSDPSECTGAGVSNTGHYNGDYNNHPENGDGKCYESYGIYQIDRALPPGYSGTGAQGTTLTVVGSHIGDSMHSLNLNIGSAKMDIESNYLDPIAVSSDDHTDGIFTNGLQGGMTVKNNNITLGSLTQTTPLAMFNGSRNNANWQVIGNQVSGGSYCAYAGSLGARNITFQSNVFVTNGTYPRCADKGFVNAWDTDSSNVWGGNAEPYTDSNANGKYDSGEPFTDSNANGVYDGDRNNKDSAGNVIQPTQSGA